VLCRKAYEEPARLTPSDLEPVRNLAGEGALDYALVLGSFHFINRIADLLHVDPEALPAPLRRFEILRRFTVWVASFLVGRMDLSNREYRASYQDELARGASVFGALPGGRLGEALAPLEARPKLMEAIRLALEERDERSSIDRPTLARIHETVEQALPASTEDTRAFHERPRDPVDAFAFVGTRYAYRATEEMIGALREAGYDDLGVLDLAVAVADANQWARLHRLIGLPSELFYLRTEGVERLGTTPQPHRYAT